MWKMACWGYSFIASKSDDAEAEQLASNPFYKLEHDLQDKKKAEEALPVITQLQMLSDKTWSDPFSNSQRLRKRFRVSTSLY